MESPDVVIAGAGPVGLTLAIELGQQGVTVVVYDKRPGLGKLPKMERCNARTMENFRRMGISDEIRAAGLDNDMPMDVFICWENIVNPPLVHHAYPSVRELQAQYAQCTDGSQPAEPYQLISQYTLEPLLRDVAEATPGVRVVFGSEVIGFEQDGSTVVTTVRSSSGPERSVSSSYLVGCDGASSTVREQLGTDLVGESLLEMRQALFQSDDLLDRIPIGIGRHYHIADDKSSFLIVQDDKKHFSLHATVATDEEMPPLFEKIVGFPIEYETLYIGKWTQRLMLADRYREDRVFLAGDSVHLVIPTGGLGMNTGHGDAIDLAWKLAATLKGWGGPELLDSYEVERRQIGKRNIAASTKATKGRRAWRSLWRPEIAEDSPRGMQLRNELSRVADVEQRWSNDLYGIELGYRYANSPVIEYDGFHEEDTLDFAYVPTTSPGSRLPHIWLDNGSPIQDVLARGYTLIAVDSPVEAAQGLTDSFERLGVPFSVYSPQSQFAKPVYGRGYILVRPDLHIVWRGSQLPEDSDQLSGMVTGNSGK